MDQEQEPQGPEEGLANGVHKLSYGGYVRLIDVMGGDESVIEAARMSTGKGFLGWGEPGGAPGDEKLLAYLWDNEHTSPFEMIEVVFEIEAPIFCARQVFRHRTFSFNEFSQRYAKVGDPASELNEEYAWTPPSGGWRVDAKFTGGKNKQGSARAAGVFSYTEAEAFNERQEARVRRAYAAAWLAYREMLRDGVAKEQARTVLPLGTFTRWRQKGNLRNWFHYLRQRLHAHAQEETREIATAQALFISGAAQRCWELFERDHSEDLFLPEEG